MFLLRNAFIVAAATGLMLASAGTVQAAGGWISYNDYPAKALREGRQGVVGFRVIIDTQGNPESCEITRSSGHDDLDEATCAAMMRRARFAPATDAEGNPAKGTFNGTFRWVIPQD